MLGPPVLIGDRVAYVGAEEPVLATVRWLGKLPEIFHNQLVAGISLVCDTCGHVTNYTVFIVSGRATDTGHH